MIQVAGRPYRVHVLRLLPGEDVRGTLTTWCTDQGIAAAVIVSAVGSLSVANLRYGGRSEGSLIAGDLEVCSLSGTLSKHGLHLHLSVADGDGRMSGGHLLSGSLVRTTLELAVQELGGVRLLRRHDERTGYEELVPERITP